MTVNMSKGRIAFRPPECLYLPFTVPALVKPLCFGLPTYCTLTATATMSPLHELTKRVFLDFVVDNNLFDLLHEAHQLLQPIGTYADDEDILVTALARGRSTGKSDASTFWDLHGVNSHAENIWRDYYNVNRCRLDKLADEYSSGASSASSPFASCSEAESLSAASSPPTSVEDTSDAEDKRSERSRQPSAAPEERAKSPSVAPPGATSPTCPQSVALDLESCGERMDIFLDEDCSSPSAAPEDAVESNLTAIDPAVLAPLAEVSGSSSRVSLENPVLILRRRALRKSIPNLWMRMPLT